jgi:hypothetical protein
MARMIGFMATWRTYGRRLRCEKKGFVKDGEFIGERGGLKKRLITIE